MTKRENEIRTGYYLVGLLHSVLNGTEPERIPEGITVKDLYKMAKKHSVDCMAYEGVCRIPGIDLGDYQEKWKKLSMMSAMQGAVQLSERGRIYQALTEAGIRILPLKGSIMKEMYPRQEYRQMSDLDILVDGADPEYVKDLMEAQGYETKIFGAYHTDSYVKKPWSHVEIHWGMLPDGMKNAKKYRDIWKRTYEEVPGSGIYRMTWEDFYIFMLEHFAKHFREGGSGIRLVMDMYIFLSQKKDGLDQAYIEKRLKKLGLKKFREAMEAIMEEWFVDGNTGKYAGKEETIILSGVYGRKDFRYSIRTDYLEEKFHSKWFAKFYYVWEMIFLHYDGMRALYPVLNRMPALLPVFWGYRFFQILTGRREKIKRLIKNMKKK